jgi:hypothetical protein
LKTEPEFLNEVAQDFHLAAGSQAINAGKVLHADVLPAHEVVRQYVWHQQSEARPSSSAFDLGAFEFDTAAANFDWQFARRLAQAFLQSDASSGGRFGKLFVERCKRQFSAGHVARRGEWRDSRKCRAACGIFKSVCKTPKINPLLRRKISQSILRFDAADALLT